MLWGYEMRSGGLPPLPIRLDVKTHCHALITGASGSGKSYALLFLIGSILKENPDLVLFFCDFKNSEDFEFLSGYEYYYAGDNCYQGIREYYKCFTEERKAKNTNKRYLLIAEEYPALINYLMGRDKQEKTKRAGDILNAIAEILMLGRSIGRGGFGFWCVCQRPDSTWFANGGIRENFMVVVGMLGGRMSKEFKHMIFSGEDIPDKIFKKGEGMLLADGFSIKEVKYPKINNIISWKRHIVEILKKGELDRKKC